MNNINSATAEGVQNQRVKSNSSLHVSSDDDEVRRAPNIRIYHEIMNIYIKFHVQPSQYLQDTLISEHQEEVFCEGTPEQANTESFDRVL